MSRDTHTRGPWRVSHGNAFNSSLYVMAGAAAEICEVFDDSDEMALPAEENALLLAASPDLLEVVKDLVSDCRGVINPGLYDLAVAALAKAGVLPAKEVSATVSATDRRCPKCGAVCTVVNWSTGGSQLVCGMGCTLEPQP